MTSTGLKGSSFPEDFLWGSSTAGHQVEGDNTNSDFWVLEQLEDSLFAAPSGSAIEHLTRYEADIALLARLGHNAYRFSLEWSRIEPAQGEYSSAALAHYRAVLETCRQNGLLPIVTLNHFSIPTWFATMGGWLADDALEAFARYADVVARQLGQLIGMACTLNEPNIIVQGAVAARRAGKATATDHDLIARAAKQIGAPTFYNFFFCDGLEVRDSFLKAHRLAYDALKSGAGEFPVGLCLNLRDYQLVEDTPEAQAWYDAYLQEGHIAFYEAARGDDFIGVQNYSRRRIGTNGIIAPPEGAKLTQMGVEYYPEGLENVVREAAHHSGCPVIVTENGLPTENDEDRIAFIDTALSGVANTLRSGVDVRGYIHWSTFDNYEWMSGYKPKFGLIAVDRATQKRSPKPSAQHFQNIIQTNGAGF